MLISANVLRETENELFIRSRTSGGALSGELDDFVIDNLVVLYKTTTGGIVLDDLIATRQQPSPTSSTE